MDKISELENEINMLKVKNKVLTNELDQIKLVLDALLTVNKENSLAVKEWNAYVDKACYATGLAVFEKLIDCGVLEKNIETDLNYTVPIDIDFEFNSKDMSKVTKH